MRVFAIALAALLPCVAAGPDAGKGRSMGNPSAPLLLELYSDFACPGCRHLHEHTLPQIVTDYVITGKAYLVFREFPLKIPAHVHARPAAALAVAAAHIGKYQAMSDALFRSQEAWPTSGKVWEAVAGVLTPAEQKTVHALAADPAIMAEVQRDVDRGASAGVNQTPTIIVTYKLKPQPWTQFADYSLFRGYLDGLLKR